MRLLLRKTLPFLLARKNKSKLLFCHSLCRPVGFLEGKTLPFLLARKMKINFLLLASSSGRTCGSHPLADKNKKRPKGLLYFYGGSERIRTSDTVPRIHAFQACSLNHSDTLPTIFYIITEFREKMKKSLRK